MVDLPKTPPPPPQKLQAIASAVSQTPLAFKVSSTAPHQAQPLKASSARKIMAHETKGRWIGPCPVPLFFERCMALPNGVEPIEFPKKGYFTKKRVRREQDLYKHLKKLVNGDGKQGPLFSDLVLVDSSNHSDPNSNAGSKFKPDLQFYKPSAVKAIRPNDMSAGLFSGEGKLDRADIFCDQPKAEALEALEDDDLAAPFEVTSDNGSDTRGQLSTYASEACSRQHRTHYFMLYIFHPCIRILRWDRSGVIVTERFDYVKNCQPLIEFLWRFSCLDATGQGFDPTVSIADDAETREAKARLATWAPLVERPVFRMEVPGEQATRHFLVWGALAEPSSPFGRATRGYPAIEVKETGDPEDKYSKPMFLKEQWRALSVTPEVDTLRKLKANGVEYIPTFVCGGDLGQVTLSSEFATAPWRVGKVQVDQRTHVRFVVEEVGKPLSQFTSSKKMLNAVYFAFRAHQQAFEKCGVLHRDISAGNILMSLDERRGFLIDWDLARDIDQLEEAARTLERTGTWPFMSAALLRERSKLHTVFDDIESFFWVILFHAICYLQHNHLRDLPIIRTELFERFHIVGSEVTGGTAKDSLILNGTYREPPFQFACGPLDIFLSEWRELLRRWVEALRAAKLQKARDNRIEQVQAAPVDTEKADTELDDVEFPDPTDNPPSKPTINPPEATSLEEPHKQIAHIFRSALKDRAHEWPKDDSALDQMSLHKAVVARGRISAVKRPSSTRPQPVNDDEEYRPGKKLRVSRPGA